MQHQLLKPAEAQTFLRISRSTLWRWIVEGKLKAVRIGGTVRIRQADLDAFIMKHIEHPVPTRRKRKIRK